MCWTKFCPLHALLTPWSTPILQTQMQSECQKSVKILGSFCSKNSFILTSILQEVWRVCERTCTPEISRCPINFKFDVLKQALRLPGLIGSLYKQGEVTWSTGLQQSVEYFTPHTPNSRLFHHSLWHSFL